jgi:hypothetical protein
MIDAAGGSAVDTQALGLLIMDSLLRITYSTVVFNAQNIFLEYPKLLRESW